MLYYFLYQILYRQYAATSESYFYKALNVFQYVTFRTAWATITALVITLIFGGKVIRKLAEMKFGQEIREELSSEHQAKRGTPTMGGILILGSVLFRRYFGRGWIVCFFGSLLAQRQCLER